jgi:uncharacterized protein (DUF433 family)
MCCGRSGPSTAYRSSRSARHLRTLSASCRSTSCCCGEELRTAGGKLFLDRYGELVNLSASGQLAMRKVFEAHLMRVEWGKLRSAVRLYPFVVSESADAKPIVIDPQISFGRPVVGKAFVSTRSILDRIDAGEKVEDVARDYDITNAAVEEAVVFERAA